MKNTGKRRLYKQLVAASLIMGGAFQLAAPVLAEGTAAGTSISNTATGSYDDGNNTTINTTSNTVTITVAEVAGIDVSPSNTPGSAAAGGTLNYDFTVTNTGNDATKFVLPSTATLTGDGSTGATYVVKLAGPDGILGNADDVTITSANTTASIAAGGTVKVRVVVTVGTAATAGQTITVKYGDSIDDTNTGTNQNNDDNTPNDVKTEDPTAATTDDPVNGVREDSATLDGTVSGTASVLNGTNGHANATGTDGTTRTDFTNKSNAVAAGIAPGATIDPATVTFTNTINNNGTASGNFTIQPTTATGILDATDGHLPNGTKVTITDAAVTTKTATYTWNDSTKQFTLDTGSTAVVITVAPGGTANYTVAVDLPAGTKLSTDLTTAGDLSSAYGGYPVPIAAYIDADSDNIVDTGETQNLTTDRTYTGYMAMYKEARIFDADGTTVRQAYTTNQSLLTPWFRPGNFVEYRIRYRNISETATGSTNSFALTANNFKVIEDGLTAPNNWAKDNDNRAGIDTSSVSGSATPSAGSVSFFNNDPAAAGTDKNGDGTAPNEVTRYENIVGNLLPGAAEGNFIFRRKLN